VRKIRPKSIQTNGGFLERCRLDFADRLSSPGLPKKEACQLPSETWNLGSIPIARPRDQDDSVAFAPGSC
jgi:hypothetical protein